MSNRKQEYVVFNVYPKDQPGLVFEVKQPIPDTFGGLSQAERQVLYMYGGPEKVRLGIAYTTTNP